MKKRSECDCECHTNPVAVIHAFPCCEPVAPDVLGAALLWLRNHYELAKTEDAKVKALVLDRVDRIIADCDVKIAHHEMMRIAYPIKTKAKEAK